jgi:hypothetical protein
MTNTLILYNKTDQHVKSPSLYMKMEMHIKIKLNGFYEEFIKKEDKIKRMPKV